MTHEELKFICDKKNSYTGIAYWLYWPSELYSFGKYIRRYGYYPKFLPLAVYSDHSGPSFSDVPYLHEIETEAPVFLTHRKIKADNYIKLTSKKAYPLFSPAVFYRRSNNIVQEKSAVGTIAFPVHSLPSSFEEFDISKYCHELNLLPESYKPIKICLHMHDIAKKRHEIYQELGFEVVTAGNTSDYRFIERLYEILKYSKFITSNDIGTITFFAIEMGLPFFVYGEPEVKVNITDNNFPKGKIKSPEHPQYQYLYKKMKLSENFKVANYDIKLINEVESSLGIYDGISRRKMALVLWGALFEWLFTFLWVIWLRKKLEKKVN